MAAYREERLLTRQQTGGGTSISLSIVEVYTEVAVYTDYCVTLLAPGE